MEFVVYISFRISDGYLKYVDSCDQLFLQEAIEADISFPTLLPDHLVRKVPNLQYLPCILTLDQP